MGKPTKATRTTHDNDHTKLTDSASLLGTSSTYIDPQRDVQYAKHTAEQEHGECEDMRGCRDQEGGQVC